MCNDFGVTGFLRIAYRFRRPIRRVLPEYYMVVGDGKRKFLWNFVRNDEG